jgi:hypothetical protein
MKKIIILLSVLFALVGNITAQNNRAKQFSFLDKRNGPGASIRSTVATVLTIENNKKDYSIFVLNGASANASTTTLNARFGFDGDPNDSMNIELYKVEVKGDNRNFSVDPAKTLAVKIPIYFLEKMPQGGFGSRNETRTKLNQIKLYDYLVAGEYVFIDKASVSADGIQINCYAFKIL